jgi:hypothetical protein
VTRDQRLNEIRKELALNSRLTQLLVEFSKDFADAALRRQYSTNDAAGLIRQAGLAEGAEKFIGEITKNPSTALDDRRE